MHFNLFVIPFMAGMITLTVLLVFLYIKWLSNFEAGDLKKIASNAFTLKTLYAIREVFMEGLIHRKVFKTNLLLGYMHMSLAFGWFMLIVIGKLETFFYTGKYANELYYPVFFRFFEQNPHKSGMLFIFNALMDFTLLVVLSGIIVAILRRLRPGIAGMKKAVKHSLGDRLALSTLWLIFPLRLLAESTTAGFAQNGSFMTQPIGNFLALFMPVQQLSIVFWWMYSLSLGTFMVSIPFSRYMHIPTEILLILLRNWGLKTNDKFTGFSEIEIQSCSRCGICIDTCQMNSQGKNCTSQMVYFLRDYRYKMLRHDLTDNCLLCGRCNDACPVGIDLTQQRILQRKKSAFEQPEGFRYLPVNQTTAKAEVVYFAGCMSHLSPSISRSMEKIFKTAKIDYLFMDKNDSICCGRPLKLSGQFEAAKKLMENNRLQIIASGAKTLVTSCPICYKSFKEDYHLNIRLLHHSEYLPELILQKKITLRSSGKRVVFHDPCELGRGSGIYEQPRQLLNHFTDLVPMNQEKVNSLCCGGSLGNLSMNPEERCTIQKATAEYLNSSDPEIVATSCPMCKKSIAQFSDAPVKDIAELVAANLQTGAENPKSLKHQKVQEMIEL
ncbi:MAG: (Fe-S)-binding protein [Bacteroidia bacterium]|nr:(Fe-S)-binding protein [Bacteroidia bacterium]